MKNDFTPIAIFAAIAALLYFMFKSKSTTPTGSLAATTSPNGSASGILTPVTQSTGLLSALDAFIEEPGQTTQQTSATLSQSAINSEEYTSPIVNTSGDSISIAAPSIADNSLDTSLFSSDTSDIDVPSPDDSSIDAYSAFGS